MAYHDIKILNTQNFWKTIKVIINIVYLMIWGEKDIAIQRNGDSHNLQGIPFLN